MKSNITSQESSHLKIEFSASSDVKQTESLGLSNLKQSDSDDQVMESSFEKSSSSAATTVATPFSSGAKLRSCSITADVQIVRIKHTTPFYGQKFIKEVSKKKKTIMDSDVETKHKDDFLSFPNSNQAVMFRRIENLIINHGSLRKVPLQILRKFVYVDEKWKTAVNPFEIKDPWAYKFLQSREIFLSQAEMSIHEFNKHRLNAKRLSGIKSFDSPQFYVLKTSYERQVETDAILLQALHLKRNLNLSEETCAELEKDQKMFRARILSLEEENYQLLCENNDRTEIRRRAQPKSSKRN